MENIIEADYKIVHERTLETIAAEIRTIDAQVCQTALQGAIAIGERLDEAKALVGHGNWEQWCKDNLSYSKKQAERFMKISHEYGKENSRYFAAISNPTMSSEFSISKALSLLSVPENEVEKFVENTPVQDMSVRELENEIKSLKNDKSDLMEEKDMLEELISAMEKEKAELERKVKNAESELKKLEDAPKTDEFEEEIRQLTEELRTTRILSDTYRKEIDKIRASQAEQIKTAVEEAKLAAAEETKDALAVAEETAMTKAREEVRAAAQARIDRLEIEKQKALEALAVAERKAKSMNNETIAKFKVKVDDLQKTFLEIMTAINQYSAQEPEIAGRWRQALKAVMEQLTAKL